jgi:ABC-type Fe3+/spermidine/putrescine transport system ATPase subunit
MRRGRILQVDTPLNLYQRPSSTYVANFIGTTNVIVGVVQERSELPDGGGSYRIGLAEGDGHSFEAVTRANEGSFREGERCLLCLRPENAHLGDGFPNRIPATVDRVTYIGEHWVADCTHRGGGALTINLPATGAVPRPGDSLTVGWAPQHAILLKLEHDHAA